MGTAYGVDNTGLITTASGIKLPTPGGTPIALDSYGRETIIFQMTGAVTPTFDFPVKFTRLGKSVLMEWDGFFKIRNSSDFLFTGDVVPARYFPVIPVGNPQVWTIPVVDGPSFSSIAQGTISFGPTGSIRIGKFDQTNFSNTCCGAFGSSITYSIA